MSSRIKSSRSCCWNRLPLALREAGVVVTTQTAPAVTLSRMHCPGFGEGREGRGCSTGIEDRRGRSGWGDMAPDVEQSRWRDMARLDVRPEGNRRPLALREVGVVATTQTPSCRLMSL